MVISSNIIQQPGQTDAPYGPFYFDITTIANVITYSLQCFIISKRLENCACVGTEREGGGGVAVMFSSSNGEKKIIFTISKDPA